MLLYSSRCLPCTPPTHHSSTQIAVTEPAARSNRVIGSISDTDMKAIVRLSNLSLYGVTVEEMLRLLRPSNVNFVLSVTDKTKLSRSMFAATRMSHLRADQG